MLVSRSLFLTILGSESGRLGLQKQTFGERWVAKTIVSQKLEFCWFQGPFLGKMGATIEPQGTQNQKKTRKTNTRKTSQKQHCWKWVIAAILIQNGTRDSRRERPQNHENHKNAPTAEKESHFVAPGFQNDQKSIFWLPKTWKMSCRLLVICNLFVCIACTSQSCEGRPQRAGNAN